MIELRNEKIIEFGEFAAKILYKIDKKIKEIEGD